MYDRLLDKSAPPSGDFIREYLGTESTGWIHYRVTERHDLDDIYELIKAKKKPIKK